MSEDKESKKGGGGSKPRKDWAIHLNQIEMLGRIADDPKERKGNKVGVKMLVPTFKRGGGRQWIPFTVDVVGEHRAKAMEAKIGDYMKCTTRFVERRVKDDNDEEKSLIVLQVDPFRDVLFMDGNVGEGYDKMNPPMPTICETSVLVAGRCFVNKKDREDGQKTPRLYEGENGKFCYVKFTYQDPFQEVPEGEWPKDIFLEVNLNGEAAERISKHCRHRAQVLVRGELSKKEANFQIQGKNPKEPKILLIPGGFSFANLDRGSGGQKQPTAAEGYDVEDQEGLDLDDDLPF